MKNIQKTKVRWLGTLIFILVLSLMLTACGGDEYFEGDVYQPEVGNAEEAQSSNIGALVSDEFYLEVINETGNDLCAFLAAPEDAEDFTEEHIFSEETLEPGDSFEFYDLAPGVYYLAAADCEAYEIVTEPLLVEYGQGSVVWYVGNTVEYLDEAGEQAAVQVPESSSDSSSEAAPTGLGKGRETTYRYRWFRPRWYDQCLPAG